MTTIKLRAISGTITLAILTAAGSAAADSIIWDMSAWGGPRAVTRGPEFISRELAKRTNGHFQLKIHYGEEISPAKANIDGLKIKAFQAAMFCSSYAPGKTPVMTALDLPLLPMPNFKAVVAVHEAYFKQEDARKELARWNAVGYLANALPQYEFMGVGKPPKTIEDWKGRRVRALGGIGDAMRRLGAVPTTMPAPEIYTALDRGIIDSVSLPFAYAFASYKLDELSKWFTGNMKLGTIGCHVLVSKSALEGLPAEYRKLLWTLRDQAHAVEDAAYAEGDRVDIPKFRKEGLTEVRYTPKQLEQFRDIAGRPVWKQWVADMKVRGYPGQKLLDFVLDKAREVSASG